MTQDQELSRSVYNRAYYIKHRKRLICANAGRRLADPEKHRAQRRAWVKTAKGIAKRNSDLIVDRLRSMTLKRRVFLHYFGPDVKCTECGVKDLRVLSLHHRNHDGAQHRK